MQTDLPTTDQEYQVNEKTTQNTSQHGTVSQYFPRNPEPPRKRKQRYKKKVMAENELKKKKSYGKSKALIFQYEPRNPCSTNSLSDV